MTFDAHPAWRLWLRWLRPGSGVSGGERFSVLSFREAPGPLLAVAGLSGGAGASVLAYLIAVTAARESSAPVLVTDTGGPTGGLASHAGISSPRTLADIAQQLAACEPLTGGLWAEGEHGLRVLASAPQFTVDGDRDAILRILADARQAHGLTVADVGTLARAAERTALTAATHVAWVLPASEDGLARAHRVLERIAPLSRPEILIARADPTVRDAPVTGLADLADSRRAPLVLMPALGRISHEGSDALLERAQVALQAIGGALRR